MGFKENQLLTNSEPHRKIVSVPKKPALSESGVLDSFIDVEMEDDVFYNDQVNVDRQLSYEEARKEVITTFYSTIDTNIWIVI
jgi:hypothetical protein